jgi:hypothetical protein
MDCGEGSEDQKPDTQGHPERLEERNPKANYEDDAHSKAHPKRPAGEPALEGQPSGWRESSALNFSHDQPFIDFAGRPKENGGNDEPNEKHQYRFDSE